VGGVDEVFDCEAVVMVAAGLQHTACVMAKGTLWTWGNASFGQLGHGDRELRQRPARLGTHTVRAINKQVRYFYS